MEDAELAVAIEVRAHRQGKAFFDFLRRAARKHSLRLCVSSSAPGRFTCSVPRKEVQKFELFLQELIFNHGLYYYLCSLPNRTEIARVVVRPIFRELLEFSFGFLSPSIIRKHVLEGSGGWVAGEFADEIAQRYETLFWRLKLKMISGYEFIRDLDDLLTEFMLRRLGYKKGQKSVKFNLLVDECGKKHILWERDIRKRFNRVHALRTRGLHRLEREIPDSEISQIALQMYFAFEYVNDYSQAQNEKTVVLSGRRYRRVRYGNELRHWNPPVPADFKLQWAEIITRPCHDCGVRRGELHLEGCDMEVCPCCGHQYLCCECKREYEEDDIETLDADANSTQLSS
jgi:hypothetical protein